MTQLSDLFDMTLFEEMRNAGFVKVQRHPEFPDELAIANYTAKAQQNYHWNDVTEQCRGLIYNPVTFQVIARPFRKFYNYDEKQAPYIADDERVFAFDKLDGSLGIVYMRPDGDVAVATRGSFTSEQALWATKWVHEDATRLEKFRWNTSGWNVTDLFEIIYHENRIVVDYAHEGLRYLATVGNGSGIVETHADLWEPYVLSAKQLYDGPFKGLWDLPERDNAEGFVVHVAQAPTRMVKVKYDEYVRIHRIVTRLSQRAIWEMMDGPNPDKIDDLVARIPEEHGKWAREVAEGLMAQYFTAGYYIVEMLMRMNHIKGVDAKETRKLKALYMKDAPAIIKSCVFAVLDGKTYRDILWKSLRPKGDDVDA